jgi:hypothetical protein
MFLKLVVIFISEHGYNNKQSLYKYVKIYPKSLKSVYTMFLQYSEHRYTAFNTDKNFEKIDRHRYSLEMNINEVIEK